MNVARPPQLADEPLWRGVIVPKITLRHLDGTPILGEVDHSIVGDFLAGQQCQLCGKEISSPRGTAVVMARPADFDRGLVNEPAQHRWCADYSVQVCPMLSGRLDQYRTVARSDRDRCGDPRCHCATWDPLPMALRAGQPADPWYAVRFPMADYRMDTIALPGGSVMTGVSLTYPRSPHIRLVTPGRPDPDNLKIIARLGLPSPL
ncbi:hypothetical protein ABT158_22665 [Nonomuraea sp. NPDC001636]|uniref:hypothetical protein n=1 Tax=Nonomuraea sp. NPDC001636 TaxID=3154391 RepID=UPI00332DC4AF